MNDNTYQSNWFTGAYPTNSDEYARAFWSMPTRPIESTVPQTQVDPNSFTNQAKTSWGQMDFGSKANTIFGGINALAGLYASIKGIGLAKRQLKQQQAQWNATWDAQRKTHNEALGLRAQLRNNGQADAVRREYNQYKL